LFSDTPFGSAFLIQNLPSDIPPMIGLARVKMHRFGLSSKMKPVDGEVGCRDGGVLFHLGRRPLVSVPFGRALILTAKDSSSRRRRKPFRARLETT
jgi:hypothetical protein